MVYSHCVQMNKNKIHIWLIWHRIIHLFGRNETPSVAYYIHSITLNKILKCNNNKPTMKPSVFRSNVCIVLVEASLRPLCLPVCLRAYFIFCRCHYWFCFIIFFILEWIKIGWLTEERLSVCVCMIIYVHNFWCALLMTWHSISVRRDAQNQFRYTDYSLRFAFSINHKYWLFSSIFIPFASWKLFCYHHTFQCHNRLAILPIERTFYHYEIFIDEFIFNLPIPSIFFAHKHNKSLPLTELLKHSIDLLYDFLLQSVFTKTMFKRTFL